MDSAFSRTVYDDVVEMEAKGRGFTTDTLPALRQYRMAKQRGDLEAVRRIGENLKDFFGHRPVAQQLSREEAA